MTNQGADERSYAAEIQHLLAGIAPGALERAGVTLKVTTHDDFTSFVKSKAGIDEEPRVARIEEFVTQRDEATGRPIQVRAKVKTGEALNAAFPAGDGPALAAQRDVTGADLINAWVTQAVAAADGANPAVTIVVDADSMAAAGQDWVPEFTSAWSDDDGVVHLQSRSMFIATTHPLPEGFVPPTGVLGVHYVAVPSPELIADLVSGATKL